MDIRQGDCREVLKELAAGSIDACVTDPPYHLTSIVQRFGSATAAPAKDRDGLYKRASAGFMGKQWDGGDIAFTIELWQLVWRCLKPGAHLIAFGGTRTYHRMACAIEDAGFEIRDQIGWLYGSGFPKSHNIGNGWGTALKPAWEPIVLARKPLIGTVAETVLEHGTGALNIDGCRVGTDAGWSYPNGRGGSGWHGQDSLATNLTEPKEATQGRWPANVLHDGSEEVLAAFAAYGESASKASAGRNGNDKGDVFTLNRKRDDVRGHDDFGTAARFFYSAKADAEDRLGSKHPTVKPVDLMAYLCRLVTPPGGTVLDPFAGSGSTGMACLKEGFQAVLIEREAEYVADIRRRLKHVRGEDTPLFGGLP
jgi:site-specific DNA-methyltransferase (adenine-specific)